MQTIRGAGHYVYADQPDDFNHRVLQVCDKVDLNEVGYWPLEKKGNADTTLAANVEMQEPLPQNRDMESLERI